MFVLSFVICASVGKQNIKIHNLGKLILGCPKYTTDVIGKSFFFFFLSLNVVDECFYVVRLK